MNELLSRVLSCFPTIDSAGAQMLPAAGGFSGAGVWRVSASCGTYALRGWPPESLPEPRILGLHKLLRHIADSGFEHVAVPSQSSGGSTLVKVKGQFWQLEPWLPGAADFHSSPTKERLSNTMRALAGWHIAAAGFRPPNSATTWFTSASSERSPAIAERLQRTEAWLRGDLNAVDRLLSGQLTEFSRMAATIVTNARLALPAVRRELAALTDVRVPLQPCLRDVWHDHILFEGDRVTGIIDPSACRTENVATDLARLLGSLVADDVQQRRFALDCYTKLRPMTPEEQRLVTVLDRSAVVLGPLTWLRRKYLVPVSFNEGAVLLRLKQQCDRLLVLTQSLPTS